MRTAIFAKLKRVPKIVGSVNHAIIPMPPVSHFVLPSHYWPVLHFGHSLTDVLLSGYIP